MNTILTQTFKNLIQKKGLVNTGALLNSVSVSSRLSGSTLYLDLNGVDYLPYVASQYKLIEEWQKDPQFSQEVSNLISPVIEKMVEDSLNGLNITQDPSIFVTINGV